MQGVRQFGIIMAAMALYGKDTYMPKAFRRSDGDFSEAIRQHDKNKKKAKKNVRRKK